MLLLLFLFIPRGCVSLKVTSGGAVVLTTTRRASPSDVWIIWERQRARETRRARRCCGDLFSRSPNRSPSPSLLPPWLSLQPGCAFPLRGAHYATQERRAGATLRCPKSTLGICPSPRPLWTYNQSQLRTTLFSFCPFHPWIYLLS